jgi:hypothetical protein
VGGWLTRNSSGTTVSSERGMKSLARGTLSCATVATTPESRTPTVLGIIGAVSGLVGAIIALLALVFSVMQAQVSSAKITYPTALRSPSDCTFQTTREGFQLSGKATLLTGDALWVLFSAADSPFYVMSRRPVATSSGHWSANLSDVGDPNDPAGAEYTFWVVSATPNGSKSILNAFQELDGKLRQLPKGVNVMATGCAHR